MGVGQPPRQQITQGLRPVLQRDGLAAVELGVFLQLVQLRQRPQIHLVQLARHGRLAVGHHRGVVLEPHERVPRHAARLTQVA